MGWCDFCNRTDIPDDEIKIIKTNMQTIYICKRCYIETWRKNHGENQGRFRKK